MVCGLACSNDPESYAGGSFMLLVAPTKLGRLKGRDQTRFNPKLSIRGLSIGLITPSCKKTPVTETAIKTITASARGLPSQL